MSFVWGNVKIPTPKYRIPFIGDLDALKTNIHEPALRRCQTIGSVHSIKAFGNNYVFCGDAFVAADLCTDKFDRMLFPALSAMRRYVGDGLFTAYNNETSWHVAHEVLAPGFSKKAMESYFDSMLQVNQQLHSRWSKKEDPFDLSKEMTRVTFETISRVTFSRDLGSLSSDKEHPFVSNMINCIKWGYRRSVASNIPMSRALDPFFDYFDRKYLNDVNEFVDSIISHRISEGRQSDDLLDRMLSDPRMRNLDVRRQILTFLVAGHDSTAGLLSFALLHLIRNPKWIDMIRNEYLEVIGSFSSDPSFEDIAKLRVTRRVIDETLRLTPSAPAFARQAKEDVVVGDKYNLNAGDWAILILPAVHTDPRVWGDNACEFNPDNFLPQSIRARPVNAFRPFGYGPRACIGRQLAITESILILSTLVSRFDIRIESYTEKLKERLTVAPDRLVVRVQPRSV